MINHSAMNQDVAKPVKKKWIEPEVFIISRNIQSDAVPGGPEGGPTRNASPVFGSASGYHS